MAFSLFGGGGSASFAKYFNIAIDEDYIVFRGSEDEAASAHLTGRLLLCVSEPLNIKHLRLHLNGISRVCWHLPSTSAGGGRKNWREKSFYEKTWRFREPGKGKTETLRAGNYEYPFDVILPGSLPESVEGLTDTYVTYRFKAEIGRKYVKDIVVRRPLRIIRTLGPSALELSHAMSVENIWPSKIEYSISTQTKAVIFGTTIQIDFKLIPLLKGLRIGQIVSQLVESHDLTLNPDDPESFRNTYKNSRTIATDEHELDEETDMEVIDEAAEGYQFTRDLVMPKTLSKCLQDTETRGIKIRHKLKFRIQLYNPDGHISELRATLPVSIFISPNLPIDDQNNLVDQSPQTAQRALEDLAHQAPPLYGEHQFDQLFSVDQLYHDIDPSGYRTPSPMSGPGTPFGALSRNMSAENLASMNALTDTDISPSALHSRLSSLRASRLSHHSSMDHDRRPESRLNIPGDHAGHSAIHSVASTPRTTPGSPILSRRPSDETYEYMPAGSGAATPAQQEHLRQQLSRVPSYETTIRTHVRPRDPGLPEYRDVYPNAPEIPSTQGPSPPQSPQRAHVRDGGRVSDDSIPSLEVPRQPSLFQSRSTAHVGRLDDEESNLRFTQARA